MTPLLPRVLGPNGPTVSGQALGCMGMSEFYGTADEGEALRTIHRALELGVSFLDTADMYGPFTNEELVGRAIADRRDQAFIATKFAIQRGEDGSWQGISGRPEYVKQSCEASLRRLGVDTIDLYYQHRVDPSVPIEDTVGAMKALVEEGKVRYLGLSEAGAETLQRAFAVHPIHALQSEWSIWSRDIEDGIVPKARELGVSLVAYSPLGRGFLTGKYKSLDAFEEGDYRRNNPRFRAMEKNLQIVAEVEAIAAERGATAGQIALAWVHAKGDFAIPLAGTKRVKYLEENAGAVEIALTEAEVTRLDALHAQVEGTRYEDMSMVGR
ncbi:MAG: aldo/keto reductase [Myxococcota bacterium]